MGSFSISGNIVDLVKEKIFPGIIYVNNGVIQSIDKASSVDQFYILPGFIDAHVHVESSMVVPSEFARMAVVHGTVATISDPHEIGNVMGMDGVKYMIESGDKVNFKFFFGAPSCVPATSFETAGAKITAGEIEQLFQDHSMKYLSEMMNWAGVLSGDQEVFSKLNIAKKYNKVIDGHAPGLRGEQAQNYIAAGISTDHECFTAAEALDKLKYEMKIIIREGSAAKNFEALIELLPEYADDIMFCSDDKHPDDLVEGHINLLVKRALHKGHDLFKVLKVACLNPIDHYDLEVGRLRIGDPADFIVVNDLKNFQVLKTIINGELVAENGISKIPPVENDIINNFNVGLKTADDFKIASEGPNIKVIEALDGQLITQSLKHFIAADNGWAKASLEHDILKIVVVNRYIDSPPAVAFVKNFGLQKGAIASSVAHDSHNIIAVGVDDESICQAVNLIIQAKGGVSAVGSGQEKMVALPVAGLMSNLDGYQVAEEYTAVDALAKQLGSKLRSPYMTLSFMALLVIPSLKLSDRGLFDADKFRFTDLFEKVET